MQDTHPKATVPSRGSLTKTQAGDAFASSLAFVSIQVAGDYAALLVREMQEPDHAYVDLWNWTQGGSSHRVCILYNKSYFTLIPLEQCKIMEMDDIGDICFLSARTLLVTKIIGNCIDIYKIDDSFISDHILTSMVRFELPALALGRTRWPSPPHYSDMLARSYPKADHIHMTNSLSSLTKPLFYPTPEDRICEISCYVNEPIQMSRIIKLYVHIRVFLGMDPRVSDFLRAQRRTRAPWEFEHVDPQPGPAEHKWSRKPFTTVPWEIWGPRNTRWRFGSWDQPYTVFGLRVVDVVPPGFGSSDTETPSFQLRIWDFNPSATSGPDGETLSDNWQSSVITECQRIPRGTIFADEVESYLPYRQVTTGERFQLSEVMIDDIQIVIKVFMPCNPHVIIQLTSTFMLSPMVKKMTRSLCSGSSTERTI
jgi:hypothetical protein